MKTVSMDELLDKEFGKKSTQKRDAFDAKVQAGVIAYQLKELRKQKNLTQQQLAELAGIDKTQISKIEKGNRNLTIETISRIVSAMGGTFNISIQV